MKKTYKIKVLPQDIKNGEATSPWSCPVALGIRRVVKKADIRVITDVARLGKNNFLLPPKCVKFIENFDDGKLDECKPFTFTMRQDNG